MQTITKEIALAALASLPRIRNGRAIMWSEDVNACAKVAAYLLTQDDPIKAADAFHKETKASVLALYILIRGKAPGGYGAWLPLRERLSEMGIAWHQTKNEQEQAKLHPSSPTTTSELPVPPTMASILPTVVTFIKDVPRPKNRTLGRDWRSDPRGVALMIMHILSLGMGAAPCERIAREAKISAQTLRHFLRGNDPSGKAWPTLRKALADLGVTLPAKVRRPASRHPVVSTVQAAVPTSVPAPSVPSQQATPPGIANRQQAGSAVQTAAAIAPPVRDWRIDPDTDDIIVTTTSRIAYGTPEHKAKLREVMLQLGAARTDSRAW